MTKKKLLEMIEEFVPVLDDLIDQADETLGEGKKRVNDVEAANLFDPPSRRIKKKKVGNRRSVRKGNNVRLKSEPASSKKTRARSAAATSRSRSARTSEKVTSSGDDLPVIDVTLKPRDSS